MAVGNCIEFFLINSMEKSGFEITEMSNAKRYDVSISKYNKLSIKYSSSGDITLHNSNSCINRDEEMKDTLLLTTNNLYLITNDELKKNNIDITEYLKNAGDSLKLKRSILKKLEKQKYPYIYNINLDKKNCKNRSCNKLFFVQLLQEFNLNK
jgi:hypothetical protein